MDPITIVMLVAIAALMFLIFRNGRKRQQAQQEMRDNLRPGVEVMLTSGIYGTLVHVDLENNRVTISSAGSELEVHAQAVSQIVPAEQSPAASAEEEDSTKDDVLDREPQYGERVSESDTVEAGNESSLNENKEDSGAEGKDEK